MKINSNRPLLMLYILSGILAMILLLLCGLSITASYSNTITNFVICLSISSIVFIILTWVVVSRIIKPSMRMYKECKELDKLVDYDYSKVNCTISNVTLCKSITSILEKHSDDLLDIFNSPEVQEIEVYTERHKAQDQAKLVDSSNMILINSIRTNPKLVIKFGDSNKMNKLCILLDDKTSSIPETDAPELIPNKIYLIIYQVISDLTRKDIVVQGIPGSPYFIKCRPEKVVINDYSQFIIPNNKEETLNMDCRTLLNDEPKCTNESLFSIRD